MHSKQKGSVGEVSVMADVHKKGLYAFTSHEDVLPFDIIVTDSNLNLYKVQVKYCSLKNGKVSVPFRTSMSNKNLCYKSWYTEDQVDVFAVYVPEMDECFYIDSSIMKQTKNEVCLRQEPTKNNQKKGIRLLKDYKQFPLR